MAKKANDKANEFIRLGSQVRGRNIKAHSRGLFLHQTRSISCLGTDSQNEILVDKIDINKIERILMRECRTIEHQFISLRKLTQMTHNDFKRRQKFVSKFLDCILKHHNELYQGVLFGSSVNGLGFKDSDLDLRLRPLESRGCGTYEIKSLDHDMAERVLTDIAYQTTNCCVCAGTFVPSVRCPVAKLSFYLMPQGATKWDFNPRSAIAGLNCDVSISSNPLGAFNSLFLRKLCMIEPKFHLLATALRFWASKRGIVQPGRMSSYALINTLIFFCQTIEPPLLPTIDEMRNDYLNSNPGGNQNGISQAEWFQLIFIDPKVCTRSLNSEPLSILMLKFFEFLLSFPYSTHIMTTRPGRALSHDEYKTSPQYHPRFQIKKFMNIQDPFDLPHNLTVGMTGSYFHEFISAVQISYDKMFKELLNHFRNPNLYDQTTKPIKWGLLSVFEPTMGYTK